MWLLIVVLQREHLIYMPTKYFNHYWPRHLVAGWQFSDDVELSRSQRRLSTVTNDKVDSDCTRREPKRRWRLTAEVETTVAGDDSWWCRSTRTMTTKVDDDDKRKRWSRTTMATVDDERHRWLLKLMMIDDGRRRRLTLMTDELNFN